MNTYTVFCSDATSIGGTTWISAVPAETLDDAIDYGKKMCAQDWGFENPDEIHVMGVIEGDVNVLHWED